MTTSRERGREDGTAAARADIEATERSAEEESRAARLFDIRHVIGGVLLVYGAILFVMGLTASDADLSKAREININLWTGGAMLLVGGTFVAWSLLSPLEAPRAAEEEEERPQRRRREAAEA